ncbi:hypothetical protein VDGL01_01570 [Verticillium dahliae]
MADSACRKAPHLRRSWGIGAGSMFALEDPPTDLSERTTDHDPGQVFQRLKEDPNGTFRRTIDPSMTKFFALFKGPEALLLSSEKEYSTWALANYDMRSSRAIPITISIQP